MGHPSEEIETEVFVNLDTVLVLLIEAGLGQPSHVPFLVLLIDAKPEVKRAKEIILTTYDIVK